MLFNKTSKLFKSWINNMISMVFQPIFAFVALAILHELFVMTLHAALSFTACPTCLLSFNIFGSYLCLPWKNAWWVALYGAHFPLQASMSSPINLLTPVLALLIVVQAMDGMVRLASSFANKIATSSFYGFDLEAVAIKTQSYATSAVSKVGNTALGMGNYDIKDRGDKKDDGNKKDNGDKKGDSKNKPDQVKRK
jgi:type IV secretory pathway VirB6-like protein